MGEKLSKRGKTTSFATGWQRLPNLSLESRSELPSKLMQALKGLSTALQCSLRLSWLTTSVPVALTAFDQGSFEHVVEEGEHRVQWRALYVVTSACLLNI